MRAPQRRLVAELHERVGLGREQRVEELVDRGRRLRADELGRDLAVAERLDRRDPLDPERPRESGVGVDVDLGQLELPGPGGGGALEHGPELPARSAPLRPEVDDHGNGVRAVDDRGLEGALGDVHGSDGSDAAGPGNLTFTSSFASVAAVTP